MGGFDMKRYNNLKGYIDSDRNFESWADTTKDKISQFIKIGIEYLNAVYKYNTFEGYYIASNRIYRKYHGRDNKVITLEKLKQYNDNDMEILRENVVYRHILAYRSYLLK